MANNERNFGFQVPTIQQVIAILLHSRMGQTLHTQYSLQRYQFEICMQYLSTADFLMLSLRGVFDQQFDPPVFENFSKFATKSTKMTVKE